MPEINLTVPQWEYLTNLDKLFDQGLTDDWIVIEEHGEIDHIKPRNGTMLPPITTKNFLNAFSDAQLLELPKEPSGKILYCRFRVNEVRRALDERKKALLIGSNIKELTPPTENKSTPATLDDKAHRVHIIETVQTPLGFFVLVILVVEAIFGITANLTSGTDRTFIINAMVGLIFLLTAIVAFMALFRPTSLYGKETPKSTAAQRFKSEGSSDLQITSFKDANVIWEEAETAAMFVFNLQQFKMNIVTALLDRDEIANKEVTKILLDSLEVQAIQLNLGSFILDRLDHLRTSSQIPMEDLTSTIYAEIDVISDYFFSLAKERKQLMSPGKAPKTK